MKAIKSAQQARHDARRLREASAQRNSTTRAAITAAGGSTSDDVLACPTCGQLIDVSESDLRTPTLCPECGEDIGSTGTDHDDAMSSVPSDSEAIGRIGGLACASCGESLKDAQRVPGHDHTVACGGCGEMNDLTDAELSDYELAGQLSVSRSSRRADGSPSTLHDVHLTPQDAQRLRALTDKIRRRGNWLA